MWLQVYDERTPKSDDGDGREDMKGRHAKVCIYL